MKRWDGWERGEQVKKAKDELKKESLSHLPVQANGWGITSAFCILDIVLRGGIL